MNQDEFKWGVNWQQVIPAGKDNLPSDVFQVLMALIEDHQAVEDEEGKLVIEDWKEEVVTHCDKKTVIVFEITREHSRCEVSRTH